jgi:hypothetical protein
LSTLIDSRDAVGVALIVVVDELDRPIQQPALGIDVIAPDFERCQQLLAVCRDPAGQCHAESDLDRVRGVGRVDHTRSRNHAAKQRSSRGMQGNSNSPQAEHVLSSLWLNRKPDATLAVGLEFFVISVQDVNS